MPLDNSAAQNAQSLLNGINYDALIGGPLQAAVRAQAMAAKSTWEFIQQVGLQKDADGHISAVNVTFLYQKDGEMVKLIVPILTIVPIPLILIDEVSVQFKANINASASSTTEESESSALAGELEASGRVGWGPFSLNARMKASYSSKKDSKATQDSRYSVEYTQDVSVHASQAGVPAGLATVLNILSNAATGASREGDLKVSPAVLTFDAQNPQRTVQVKLTDANGLNVKDGQITLKVAAGTSAAFTLGQAPLGKALSWTSDAITVKTGDDGSIGLLITADPASKQLPADRIVELTFDATVGKTKKQFTLPMKVAALLPAAGQAKLEAQPQTITVKKGTPETVTITAKDTTGKGVQGVSITLAITSQTLKPTSTTAQTDASGKATFSIDTTNTGVDVIKDAAFTAPGYAAATISVTEKS